MWRSWARQFTLTCPGTGHCVAFLGKTLHSHVPWRRTLCCVLGQDTSLSRALAQDTVLRSWARHFTLTCPGAGHCVAFLGKTLHSHVPWRRTLCCVLGQDTSLSRALAQDTVLHSWARHFTFTCPGAGHCVAFLGKTLHSHVHWRRTLCCVLGQDTSFSRSLAQDTVLRSGARHFTLTCLSPHRFINGYRRVRGGRGDGEGGGGGGMDLRFIQIKIRRCT